MPSTFANRYELWEREWYSSCAFIRDGGLIAGRKLFMDQQLFCINVWVICLLKPKRVVNIQRWSIWSGQGCEADVFVPLAFTSNLLSSSTLWLKSTTAYPLSPRKNKAAKCSCCFLLSKWSLNWRYMQAVWCSSLESAGLWSVCVQANVSFCLYMLFKRHMPLIARLVLCGYN